MDVEVVGKNLNEQLQQIDSLYDNNENEKAFNEIEKIYKENPNTDDAQILWRFARSCRDIANIKGVKDEAFYKTQINLGYEVTCKAIELAPEDPDVNKWYAIFTELSGRLIGIKKRIENSFKVQKHLEKANELRPNDFSTMHSIGVWHYEVSNLGMANRLFAKAFFSAPPTSTFENALKFLQAAEDLKPGFFASNTMYLANTYYQLRNKTEAKKYCQAVLDNTGSDLDAMQAKEEATKLMKHL